MYLGVLLRFAHAWTLYILLTLKQHHLYFHVMLYMMNT